MKSLGCKDPENRSDKLCCCGSHNASNHKKSKHHHSTKNRLSIRAVRKWMEKEGQK